MIAHSNGSVNSTISIGNGHVDTERPYRLDLLDQADRIEETVFVCDTPQNADALINVGILASAPPPIFGPTDWVAYLRGRSVAILSKTDPYSLDQARALARAIHPVALDTRVVEVPGWGSTKRGTLAEMFANLTGSAERREFIATMHETSPQYVPPDETPPPINQTDLGNARRLVGRFGEIIRHCPQWDSYLVWDGTRLREDDTGEIRRLANQIPRGIVAEAALTDNDEDIKRLKRWSIITESKNRLDAMVALAKTLEGVPVRTSELNADPWLLNLANGTFNLKTGILQPHSLDDRITKLAPIKFDPSARCPRFLAFLTRIMADDQELIGFLQRALGYALTGDVSEHALFFFYGTGRNGKSTLLETVLAILGDYATTVDAGLITVKRNEDHPTGLTDLDGRRFVPTVEVEDGKQLAEALVKKLTGGDRIKARRMREDNYEFAPSHKIFLAANQPPEIKGQDEGIWSRVKLVPFRVFIPPEERVRDLRETLVNEEGSGILNWLIDGCMEWQRGGLQEPASVTLATKDYRTSMDILGAFIEERCNSFLNNESLRTQARESKDALYRAYTEWAKDNGTPVLSARKFGNELERKGYALKPSNGRYYRLGITLKAETDPK